MPSNKPKLTRQISTSAKYYEPGVYGFGVPGKNGLTSVLSFYRDLTLTADPAAAGFIPMSAVSSRARNTKLFAIGILPPSIVVDESVLLDRSGTGRKFGSGVPNYPEDPPVTPGVVNLKREPVDGGTRMETIKTIIERHCQAAGLDPDILARLIEFETAGTFDPSIVSGKSASHAGLIQFGKGEWAGAARALGRSETWDQMRQMSVDEQMPFVIQYMTARGITGNSSPGEYYRAIAAPATIGWAAERVVYKKGTDAVRANPSWDGNKDGEITAGEIDRAVVMRPPRYPPNPISVKADVDSANFGPYGSGAANASRREQARQTDLIVQNLQDAQRMYLLKVQLALREMANTPPLRLLVNPNTFSVKSQKIASDGSWGRNGPIIEFWGDDQDKISGAGQVAAFYSLDADPQLGRGGPGLTRHARNHSLAWQNLQSLYLLYRNNGGMYLSDMSQQDRDVVLATAGSVYLFYDNILYIGCFDSLNLTEADLKPFTLEYTFEFTVRAAFLLEFASDFSYGGAAAFRDNTLGAGLPVQSRAREEAVDDVAAEASIVAAPTLQRGVNVASDAVVNVTASLASDIAEIF